ncbi:MAG: ribonuclease D [Flavobacteriales bacterium]|nr:ribonuclease D [Flavobacteriales bacterium]MBK6549820.1 ribonuclease D [Flavobacteriales bacterium]MBK6883490.1 ribonuclease D [Flavobacteriales bacterium]MBK7102338.1 ribonuclease D [Flavobacteriales bacterium]MBK7113077.1 ribonuclease D [Flavobacteriales bacterium]
MAEFELITAYEALHGFVSRIGHEQVIALDTEASSFHRYKESVCLVQISTREHTFLVDPLAVTDLTDLGDVLVKTHMEVVIHDADYDLRILAKHHGIRVENVFDTLVAAELLNEPEIGLAALLGKYQGIQVDKKFQKADWSKRPLPRPMLDYAAGDTSHLIALRDILKEKLIAADRWSWAEEEFALLTDAPFNLQANDEPPFLRVKGAKRLKPAQLAIFREVHAWRESVAERQDRASFMILGNDVLLSLATEPPSSIADIASRRGVNERMLEKHGQRILAAVSKGQAVPKEQWPRLERAKRWDRDNDYEDRLKRLKMTRDALMLEFDLRPGIVAANQMLSDIARTLPGDLEALASLPNIRRYQVKHFGARLLAQL